VGYIFHIDSAGGYIRGHEQLQLAFTERIHHHISLILAQVAVKCPGIIAVFNKLLSHFLGIAFGTAENYGENVGIGIGEPFQRRIPVAATHYIIFMTNGVYPGILCTHGDFPGLVHKFFSNGCYFLWHGCRKQPG